MINEKLACLNRICNTISEIATDTFFALMETVWDWAVLSFFIGITLLGCGCAVVVAYIAGAFVWDYFPPVISFLLTPFIIAGFVVVIGSVINLIDDNI